VNHDLGCGDRHRLDEGQLGAEAREFLSNLPMWVEDETRLYVHASAQTLQLDLRE